MAASLPIPPPEARRTQFEAGSTSEESPVTKRSKSTGKRAADRRGGAGHETGAQRQERGTQVLYRALLAAVLDPTLAIDGRGVIVTASDSVATVFGWRPDELIGKNINVLMPEPHHSAHDGYLANYRRTGVTHILGRTREFQVTHKDGHSIACELSVARADMPDGAEPLFIGAFRDVSERNRTARALEASEQRFRAIFDRSYQFVGLLRPDGTLLEANQASLDAIGALPSEVLGRKFWDTPWWSVSEESRERVRQAIEDAASGKFVRFEAVHRGRGSEVLAVDFSINPVRDATGKITLLIPEGRNISDLKRAQRAETAMLRALATIGESAAMLAHEIKNPITAVNMALRAVSKELGEDHREVLVDMVARMQRLEGLMRRTLTFAKPLELRWTTIDARELLDSTVRLLRPEIVKRGAEVRCEVSGDAVTFAGDRQLIEEVLTNLLKNALEAMTTAGHVVLSAKRCNASVVELAVDDDGPGIADSVRATLFKPFATTKAKGTGLGLAFCRKVIEEHGGSLEAHKSELGGARFAIQMPTVRDQTAAVGGGKP
jgi:PAS domain S-box-containing protein